MTKNYIFKNIPLSDLKEALSLVWRVFSEFEVPDYSAEGVEEFKKFIDYNSIKEKIESLNIFMFGCYDKNKLIGIIAYDLKPHINLMFVDKEYQRQGIAKTLFSKILGYGKYLNASEITVNSSPYAHKIYKKLGFIYIDKEQTVNGIRFYPMKYLFK